MDLLSPGHTLKGPAIVVQSISTVVVEVGCSATITSDGDMEIDIPRSKGVADAAKEEKEDKEVRGGRGGARGANATMLQHLPLRSRRREELRRTPY